MTTARRATAKDALKLELSSGSIMRNDILSTSSQGEECRVSLALPVFNGERFVGEAIQSILRQDFSDFELIIVDNASTDRTASICQEFAASDKRIKYVRNERNIGAAANFNLGFKMSTAPYFKWCADDDLISHNFIGTCVKALVEQPTAVLAYGTTECIDAHGNIIPLIGRMVPEMVALSPAQRFQKIVTSWSACFEIFGLIRREALSRSTLHRMYYGSDRALLAELALLGEFACMPDAIFYNRDHEGRSLRITDKRLKRVWHGATQEGKHALEHLPLLRHLVEIALHHRHTVPARRSLLAVSLFALKPVQLARYFLELVGVASPAAQAWLRRAGWRSVTALQGQQTPRENKRSNLLR